MFGFIDGVDVVGEGLDQLSQRGAVGVFGGVAGGEVLFEVPEVGGDGVGHAGILSGDGEWGGHDWGGLSLIRT